jgi:CubicO group peptidase (beta-lactamase class C family)
MLRLFLLCLLSLSALAADLDSGALDSLIESVRKAYQAPGVAVAIVHNDAAIYAKGFGVRKLGESSPVTADTRFAIGSTSKAFTTAAMGMLVDDGKMAWDDPVRKHVPFFRLSDPLADANVTMRDIVCHRTGLSRHDLLWYNSPWSREEIIRKIGLVPLTKPFRSAYQYQNIMFLTAGYAVGLISGSSWEEFVRKRIFTPLGMSNSDFSANDAVKARDYSEPHVKEDEAVKVIPWRNIDNVAPAGSINSSVNDLSRWVRMQLNEGKFEGAQLLKPATLREMHSAQMAMPVDDPVGRVLGAESNLASYGLAWVLQDYRGHHMVSHGGAIDGFRAQVALLPRQRYGIVILSNLGGTSLPEALRNAIADRLLGLETKDWAKAYLERAAKGEAESKKREEEREQKRHKQTKPSRELAAYTGFFEHPAYGLATVSAEGGELTLKWSNWNASLEHYHFDVFRAKKGRDPLARQLVEFRLDDNGDVSGVRFIEQEFARRKP